MKREQKMKRLGILALILSIISLSLFPLEVAFFRTSYPVSFFVSLINLGFPILSIGLGLIAYHSEKKVSFGFYAFIIGAVALFIFAFFFLLGISFVLR